jgi:hypothetical protein
VPPIERLAKHSKVVLGAGRFRSWQAAGKYQLEPERQAIRASDRVLCRGGEGDGRGDCSAIRRMLPQP